MTARTEAPNLVAALVRAGQDLGVEDVAPNAVELPSGASVRALALVKSGNPAFGMLVVTDYDQVRHVSRELQQAGFGFSVLEELDRSETFVLDGYIEMFRDWGVIGSER